MPVHVTKYDGSYYRRIPLRYVAARGPLHLGTLAQGDVILRAPDPADDREPYVIPWPAEAYLHEDRWFQVWRWKWDGANIYYVDIATPAAFDGQAFHFTDLDLDVRWQTDRDPEVLDEDEFLEHSAAMKYPKAVIENARCAVDEVLRLIGDRAFPFDRV